MLNRLKARAGESDGGKRNALYLFDYGYLVEPMKQARLTRSTIGIDNPVAALEGLPYIQEALRLRGNDSQMEFAAAVVTSWPEHASHPEHLRKPFAGAAQDTLLAKNLAVHFSGSDRMAALAN